jgi:hypothetical protein
MDGSPGQRVGLWSWWSGGRLKTQGFTVFRVFAELMGVFLGERFMVNMGKHG